MRQDPRLSLLKLAAAAVPQVPFPTRALFARFGSVEGILQASSSEWESTEGIRAPTLRRLLESREGFRGESLLPRLDKQRMRLISFADSEYPENLKGIPDPPPVLFLQGELRAEDARALAVVGSRRASAYGIAVCERLVRELAAEGYAIVSGLARGIDAAAHWACLERGGRAIAVVGTGLDVPYPKVNTPLFQRIPSQGVLVSEFLPGTQARPENFPRRNRIISGLALGVLVVEASERSGTLITVRMALEQGREVFSVPGDIRSPLSRGTHKLIKQGAKLVECLEDILEEMPGRIGHERPGPQAGEEIGMQDRGSSAESRERRETTRVSSAAWAGGAVLPLSGEAAEVVGLLSDEGILIDTLIERSGWPLEKLNGMLTELELLGRVKRLPGNRIARCGG